MMNLTIKEIKVGDEFKQTNALGTYMFEDYIFTVEKVDENKSAILLSLKSEKIAPGSFMYANVYLSLDELNGAFKRVKNFVWSDWKLVRTISKIFNYEYKTNGRVTFVKIIFDDKVFKGKATCHKDDLEVFDEKTGIELAYERAEKKVMKYKEEINSKTKKFNEGDRVRLITNKYCGKEFVYDNATGTILTMHKDSAIVQWDEGCAKEDRQWFVDLNDIEHISEQKSNFTLEYNVDSVLNAPLNYTLLHTIYAESEGEGVGLTKTVVDAFNIKQELKKELNFLLEISDFYHDEDNLKGDIVTYVHKNVITLVTKRKKYDKVSYETIRRGFVNIKKHMEENNIQNLAMPCICCGYEKLEWKKVEKIINEVFSNCKKPIHIKVYVGH